MASFSAIWGKRHYLEHFIFFKRERLRVCRRKLFLETALHPNIKNVKYFPSVSLGNLWCFSSQRKTVKWSSDVSVYTVVAQTVLYYILIFSSCAKDRNFLKQLEWLLFNSCSSDSLSCSSLRDSWDCRESIFSVIFNSSLRIPKLALNIYWAMASITVKNVKDKNMKTQILVYFRVLELW